jgi:hypothetical protein
MRLLVEMLALVEDDVLEELAAARGRRPGS